MTDGEDLYRSMREYSRVDAYIPIEVKPASPDADIPMKSRTSIEYALPDLPPLPELTQDRALQECLRILNAKLDAILHMLTLQSRDYSSPEFTHVNLSAGGVGLELQECFSVGDVAEIKMMFPTMAQLVFYIYGRVVHVEARPDGYATSFEFIEIGEDVRDLIAKYIFERQREILRKKKRE